MANVEGLILHQGLLSQEDIEEIHRVFVMMDTDGTGTLTLPELRAMIVQITKDPNISMEEARQLHSMLDTNCDGQVTWEEFLQFVCRWLHERGGARLKSRTDLPSSFNEKDNLHKCIAQLFSLDKVSFDTSQLPSDHVDNRAETWDYLGESQKFSDAEKTDYYTQVYQAAANPAFFQKIMDEIGSADASIILAGLKGLSALLGIMNVFQTPRDRGKISLFLIQLFERVIQSNVMARVIQCLSLENQNLIQWEALKIITFFAPGPRVPGLPENHQLNPRHKATKTLLLQAGAGLSIVRLCESPCLEVREQALLTIGFIARHDAEARDFVAGLGIVPVLLRFLKRGAEALRADLATVIRAAWVLSIMCGATMPKDSANPKFTPQQLVEIASTLATLFILYDQDNLIANSLTALAYTLPYMNPDQNCKMLLERVVFIIQHPNVTVKRAALQTVRNLVWASAAHSQLLTEVGLYTRLNEILSNPMDVVVKLDAFTVLRSLIQKGYTYEMMNLSLFSQQLQMTIGTDTDLRWEAVRLVKVITFSNFRIAIE
jgi:hypothetical protein